MIDEYHDLFRAGDRIIVPLNGRTGTVVGKPKATKNEQHHCGIRVEWDDPVFGRRIGIVQPSLIRILP